jgi:hypothetical protein
MAELHKVGGAEDQGQAQAFSGPLQTAAADSGVDHLNYLSDLIDELREMADKAQLETLAGILGLAFIEANKQIAARRKADLFVTRK